MDTDVQDANQPGKISSEGEMGESVDNMDEVISTIEEDGVIMADEPKTEAQQAKTFRRAPSSVQTVAVLLILEAIAGLILFPSGGAAGAVVVRALIARAAVRGAKGARTFLFVIGTLALAGGLMAMQSLDSGKGLSQFCVPLLVSGVFNLTMGFVLSTRSALEWMK